VAGAWSKKRRELLEGAGLLSIINQVKELNASSKEQ
jgi:hypothetical protein